MYIDFERLRVFVVWWGDGEREGVGVGTADERGGGGKGGWSVRRGGLVCGFVVVVERVWVSDFARLKAGRFVEEREVVISRFVAVVLALMLVVGGDHMMPRLCSPALTSASINDAAVNGCSSDSGPTSRSRQPFRMRILVVA